MKKVEKKMKKKKKIKKKGVVCLVGIVDISLVDIFTRSYPKCAVSHVMTSLRP